ncbi:MAG: hypothetical protein HC889_06410 [Synechococcaceae cyanobacterium SM1_2_3]|nr:hypothetical protein [Synechococcaceae cyanobacterium SM1_2_3]
MTSKRPVNYLGDEATTPATEPKRGWYLDLTLNAGERVVSDALILGSRFIFTSILPDPDPCEAGGKSWLNILDATTGKRISKTFLGPEDKPVTEPSTGLTPTSIEIGGIASAPNVMKSPEQGKSVLYVTTSDPTNPENLVPVPIADDEIGRQSWRQLEFFQ